MIVDDVGIAQVHLVRRPDAILGAEHPHLLTVFDTALNQGVSVARERLSGRVCDLTSQSEAARRIAEWACVALHENAMKHGIFRVINPVLLRQVLASDS